ncbi:site-specific recombinase XerD [Streptacidiphilus sp. MAP12-16]|uniref:tyrosine-type recombinase/integrase n=1 Tax=Streptacidiphilus sp. MAP12-16 TaxID=3156300 RepID=UPI003511671E
MARTLTRPKLRPAQPEVPKSKFDRNAIDAAPAPAPEIPPRPCGVLDCADAEQIRAVAKSAFGPTDAPSRTRSRDSGLRTLLDHLASFPGTTWQERWQTSGLNTRGRPVRDLAEGDGPRAWMTQGLEALFCLRIIQPTLEAFRSNQFTEYPKAFHTAQQDPALEAFFTAVEATGTSRHWKRRAVFDVCTALTTQGIAFADLTPEAFLHYARTTRDAALSAYSYATYVGHLAWQVMHETGHFPNSAPSTLRAALRAPKLTCQELVAQHGINNAAVRDLLIQYLERRSHDLDYSSLTSLSYALGRTFWKTVETVNPDQASLQLSEDTYQHWREAIRTLDNGKPRRTEDAVFTTVRAFYYDIQAWAGYEPERWANWAVPCPIPHREIRAGAKRRRRTRERMADQTRQLQPLLPALVRYVEDKHRTMAALLADGTGPDDVVAIDSRIYRRLFTAADRRRASLHGVANVRFQDEEADKAINVTLAEDTAFWQWAIVEALRHTGVRIEELLELSQLSIRQYQRPNGEVVALLVIAPSKTDRERVIPVSAELFHVLACIIRRLTNGRSSVPLATRYDEHERVTSEPQPFLFQRRIGQRNEVMTTGAVREMLRRVCGRLADEDPRFGDLKFAPHDFRRLFATDLVNNGLPIHIGAALLGHLNLETTRGYVAVFEEDVVRHYQTHLARRRTMRPQEEYRPVTDTEWQEFEEHFDKRKLELGNCGRPYATPCSHEHACIRCPMLHVDPKMLDRLAEIETDLLTRRERAESEGWLGEIEGVDLTLSFLKSKRAEALRLSRATAVDLGMPAPRERDR